jgi:YVTN family beta-propeller protein
MTPAQGTGDGTTTITALPNATQTSRSADVTIAGRTFTLTQPASVCSYTVGFPIAAPIPSLIGNGSASVTTASNCAWAAISDAPWFTITSGATGTGSGTVTFDVAANTTGASRDAHVTIADQIFTVTQLGIICSVAVSFPTFDGSSAGATGTATVTAAPGCSWTASSDAPWVTITSGASGTGNGSVGLAMAANIDASARTARVFIGNLMFTIAQAAAPCAITVGGTGVVAPAVGGTGTIGVATAPGCAWTATSDSAWVTITGGASGSGNGSVAYNVAINTTTAVRHAVITIGGRSFTVDQSGAVAAVTLNPITAVIGVTGGNGTVSVTANPTDTWTVTSTASWLHVTSPTSGTGAGSVAWSADANPNAAARSASLIVGAQPFLVRQAGAAAPATPLLFVTNVDYTNTKLAIVAADTKQVLAQVPTPGGFTHAVTVTPDGSEAWAANNFGNTIVVASATSGTVVATIPISGNPRGVAFTPDGRRAYAVNETGYAFVIDTATKTVTKTIDIGSAFWDYVQFGRPFFMNIAMAPDGRHAYLSDVKGALVVLDTTTDTPITKLPFLPGFDSVQWVGVTPDATMALLPDSNQVNAVWAVDLVDYKIIKRIPVGGAVRGVTILPNGSRAYVANEFGTGGDNQGYVSVIDLKTLSVVDTIVIKYTAPRGIVADPDGTKVYGTTGRRIYTIDVATDAVSYSAALSRSTFKSRSHRCGRRSTCGRCRLTLRWAAST